MNRESIEVMVDAFTDVFSVRDYLLKQPQRIKARVVTCDTLRISYDADKIVGKLILKMIGRCSKNKNSRGRSNNVISIRTIQHAAQETTDTQES